MSSYDFHLKSLHKLCRCGRRLTHKAQDTRKLVEVSSCRKEISLIIGANTWEDRIDQHPRYICLNCSRKIRHLQAGTRAYSTPDAPAVEWTTHVRNKQCKICDLYHKNSKTGPQSKSRTATKPQSAVLEELPFDISLNNIFEQLSPKTQDVCTESSPHLEIFGRKTDEHSVFICSICQCIISTPSVQTPCEHYFCAVCLSSYFKINRSSLLKCPSCMSPIQFTNIRESPRILNVQLQNLDVACSVCGVIGRLQSLAAHSCNASSKHNDPQNKPRCTVIESATPTKPADSLAEAAAILRKSALQHPHGQPIPLAVEKAADRWTWIKPFFSYMPTPTISSERAMRRSQKELLKNYVEGEMVALQFSSSKADAIDGYILQDAPFVRVNDICAMIFDYLDRLDLFLKNLI